MHRRVIAIALFQLDRQAFGEVACEDAGRVEVLQLRQHFLDPRDVATHKLGNGGKLDGDIAGLVELIDKVCADHAVSGISHLFGELGQQVLAERRGPRQGLVKAGKVVTLGPCSARFPSAGIAGQIEIAFAIRACNLVPSVHRFFMGALAWRGGFGSWLGRGRGIFGRRVVALQQRILLQLAFDIGRQLDIR